MSTENRNGRPSAVIIGAGFAGLWAARTLAGKNLDVILLDRNNYHTFLPLLYQVGSAEIEPEQIAYPLRSMLRKFGNIRFIRGEVNRLNLSEKHLLCNGRRIDFDYCLLAAGSTTNYFNTPGAERTAFPLKTLDDAVILRNHIRTCFERAACSHQEELTVRLLTFVIVGGGPTGIELAGALSELIRGPLRKDYPGGLTDRARVILVEASGRVLGMLPEGLSLYTQKKLDRLGVELRLGSPVKEITGEGVRLIDGTLLPAETVVWSAGVRGDKAAEGWGLPLTGDGRVRVTPVLRAEGMDHVFVAGDLACFIHEEKPLPQIAPVALQQGVAAARNIIAAVEGKPLEEFRYRDRGTMVTIGRNAAVARIGGRSFRGFAAWIIWLVIHIMNLIGFRNKILVMINWAWDYFLFERAVRLILPRCCDNPSSSTCMRRCP